MQTSAPFSQAAPAALAARTKHALRLCTTSGSRDITRQAAAGMLRAARVLRDRRIGYSLAYSARAGIVRGEGPRGVWQLEHARGAA